MSGPVWVPLTPEQIEAVLDQPEPTDWHGRKRLTLRRARAQLQRFLDEHRDREARRAATEQMQRAG